MAFLIDFYHALMTPTLKTVGDECGAKNRWLCLLRWVAIFAQLIVIGPGVGVGLLDIADVPKYLAVVATLVLLNIYLSRSDGRAVFRGEGALFVQLSLDVLALTLLLNLSKGCANPLVVIFYLNAALGPMILTGVWNNFFLLITCLCYGIVCYSGVYMQHAGIPREIKLGSELAVLIIMWRLTTFLSRYLTTLHSDLEKLQRQRARVDNLRMLGAVAASFSHEFSTPLNTIKIRLSRISRKMASNSDLLLDINSAVLAVNQCETVLRSLFGSQSQAESIQLNEITIAPFIEKICDKWSAGQSDVQLDYHADQGAIDTKCRLPKILFTRSMIDILDNAFQASQGNQAQIKVAVSTDNQHVWIDVADRGIGMEIKVKERFGEAFISARPGGTGLGIFTALSLLEGLGGTLHVLDRFGGGTTMRLQIPIAKDVL